MKNIVAILTSLMIFFGGFFLYVRINDQNSRKNEIEKITVSNKIKMSKIESERYQFQDVEEIDKAQSIEEAFDFIFGKDRLFNNTSINFFPGNIDVNISGNTGTNTRMEMIDFLNYIQYSNLITTSSINDKFKIDNKEEPYNLNMVVYGLIEPGMNDPEPQQTWILSTDKIELMDFTDKNKILSDISLYGDYSKDFFAR